MAWRGQPQFGTLARGRFCPLERSPIPQRPAVATASQTRTATRSHPHPSPSRPDRARPALPQGLAAPCQGLLFLQNVRLLKSYYRVRQVLSQRCRNKRQIQIARAGWPQPRNGGHSPNVYVQMDATPLGKICIKICISATLKPVVLGGAQPASDK